MNYPLITTLLLANLTFAESTVRDCAKPERWAASMAQTHLQNAGLLKSEEIDFAKKKVTLLAQEKLKKDLFRQIQKIVFVKKTGEALTALTENDASEKVNHLLKTNLNLLKQIL